MRRETEHPLHVIAVLPPPITGQTIATLAMVKLLEGFRDVHLRLTSRSGPPWHATKHLHWLSDVMRAAKVSRGQHDLYMVPDSGAGLLTFALCAPLIRRSFRRVILHHHAMAPLSGRNATLAAALKMLEDKTLHIVLGQDMADGLRFFYGVDPKQIHRLGNAPLVAPPRVAQARPRAMRFGFIGNITQAKGIFSFMAVLRNLQSNGRFAEAVIAGPVRDGFVQAEINRFISEDPTRRRTLGAVEGRAKTVFFASIDALLFPSTYANEAQPLTIYEALSAHRPVLAIERGEIRDQLPAEWLFSEVNYVAHATAAIARWQDRPDAFPVARTLAKLKWEAALARDRAEARCLPGFLDQNQPALAAP